MPGRRWLLPIFILFAFLANRPWPRLEQNVEWSLKRMARLALARNQPETAVKALREALRSQPDDLESFRLLARALEASGRHETAFAVLRRAEKLHPHSAKLRLDILRLLVGIGRCDLALPRLERWRTAHPLSPRANALLNVCRTTLLHPPSDSSAGSSLEMESKRSNPPKTRLKPVDVPSQPFLDGP